MRLKHYDHDGRARFITFCIHRRTPLLTNNTTRQAVSDAIETVRHQSGLRLLAWVYMPDHVHLVVVPPVEVDLGRTIGEIKRLSGRAISVLLDGREHRHRTPFHVVRDGQERTAIWQRRCFDRNLRSDEAVVAAIQYCHNNPVRAGLVDESTRWSWSSCRWYAGLANPGMLVPDGWNIEAGSREERCVGESRK